MNLRKIVVISLILIIGIIFIKLTTARINTIKKIADKCDNSNFYTCDYYKLKNFNR